VKASPTEQKELLRLQAIDTRVQQLAHQLANLPEDAALADLAKKTEEVRRRLIGAVGELDDAKLELSRLEADVAVVEARIARDNERVQHTSSVKDIQGLEAELTSLRKRQGDLEEIELTVMERVEDREAVVAGIEGERNAIADQVSVTEQERDRTRAAHEATRAELTRDREAVSGLVPDELRELYEKRRAVGGGVGAALMRARTCSGCNMALTGSDLEAVRTAASDEVLFCPDCGRILVRTEESGI
jgi:uncharacterized protein